MKNNSRSYPEATHFVGVLIPDELEETLEDCRAYMRERYGCRSGQRTPLHVTLIPPFLSSRSVDEEYLLSMMRYALSPLQEEGSLPFDATVRGFGSFGERTLFASVDKNVRWTRLKRAIEEEFVRNRVGDVKVEKKPFVPQLTVANRDIPPGKVGEILEHFASLDLLFKFSVIDVCLFVWDGHG
ncbi:MAG: 2'-5' RNA ligase family protein, partial [Spirochaetales bacterium]|nr:2'-5' RNA ligase family protein [Candidatus Physcosoma equi]